MLQHRTDLFPLTDISVLPPCTPFFTLVGRAGLSRRRVRGGAGFSATGCKREERPSAPVAENHDVCSDQSNPCRRRPVEPLRRDHRQDNCRAGSGSFSWVQPWGTSAAKAALSLPQNASTHRAYSGINVLILWGAVVERGFSTQSWTTYRQAFALGGNVRRGEHGTTVVYTPRTG